jgi:hypothetical protein
MRIAILILALLVTGCTAVGPVPSASTTTAHPEWQHYFKITYDVQPYGEARRVSGYIMNDYGVAMRNVQLLVQALDPGENLVAQRLTWVPGGVPGFGRTFFQVAGLPVADKYRVTVWSFERVETDPRWPLR